MRQYFALFMTMGFGFAVAAGMLLFSVLFGPKKKTRVKQESFECGMPPAMERRCAAGVNFYLIAVLFVMFDTEIAFLYPWAASIGQLGRGAFLVMAAFLTVIFAALVYAVKKGALEWD